MPARIKLKQKKTSNRCFFAKFSSTSFEAHFNLVSLLIRASDGLERFYGECIGVLLEFGVEHLKVSWLTPLAQFAR